MPDFSYDPDQSTYELLAIWKPDRLKALVFGGLRADGFVLDTVAMAFDNQQYAVRIAQEIESWIPKEDRQPNKYGIVDARKYLRASIVEEDDVTYAFYLYKIIEDGQIGHRTIICKLFNHGPNSAFTEFREEFLMDQVVIKTCVFTSDRPEYLNDATDLLMPFNIKRRSELTLEDIEYVHGVEIMDKPDTLGYRENKRERFDDD